MSKVQYKYQLIGGFPFKAGSVLVSSEKNSPDVVAVHCFDCSETDKCFKEDDKAEWFDVEIGDMTLDKEQTEALLSELLGVDSDNIKTYENPFNLAGRS